MKSAGAKAKQMTGRLLGEKRAYAHGHDRPLGSFLIIMGAYGTAVTGMAAFLTAGGGMRADRGPRTTRAVASVFAVLTGSDMLQYAHAKLQES